MVMYLMFKVDSGVPKDPSLTSEKPLESADEKTWVKRASPTTASSSSDSSSESSSDESSSEDEPEQTETSGDRFRLIDIEDIELYE